MRGAAEGERLHGGQYCHLVATTRSSAQPEPERMFVSSDRIGGLNEAAVPAEQTGVCSCDRALSQPPQLDPESALQHLGFPSEGLRQTSWSCSCSEAARETLFHQTETLVANLLLSAGFCDWTLQYMEMLQLHKRLRADEEPGPTSTAAAE